MIWPSCDVDAIYLEKVLKTLLRNLSWKCFQLSSWFMHQASWASWVSSGFATTWLRNFEGKKAASVGAWAWTWTPKARYKMERGQLELDWIYYYDIYLWKTTKNKRVTWPFAKHFFPRRAPHGLPRLPPAPRGLGGPQCGPVPAAGSRRAWGECPVDAFLLWNWLVIDIFKKYGWRFW